MKSSVLSCERGPCNNYERKTTNLDFFPKCASNRIRPNVLRLVGVIVRSNNARTKSLSFPRLTEQMPTHIRYTYGIRVINAGRE